MSPGGSTKRADLEVAEYQGTDLEVAEDPAVDCFCAYPTASSNPGPLAELDVDDSEESAVWAQAAQFATTCGVFAPAYQQIPAAVVSAGRDSA
jgi:hypothetical protein